MNENYGADAWREPTYLENDVVLFSEHGRVLNNICYRSSHWVSLVTSHNVVFLVVKHGGGEERHKMGYCLELIPILKQLTSDDRYYMLYTMLKNFRDGKHAQDYETAQKYKQAFVDGRLKKRKIRDSHDYKVWIES